MSTKTGQVLGVVFVLYGVFKICVALLAFLLPPKIQQRMHDTPLRMLFPNDATTAGRTVDVLLFVYAVYSIFHGLNLIGINVPFVSDLIAMTLFKTLLYVTLGMVLIIFYTLILATKVPISSKKPSEDGMYVSYVVVGSLFLMTALLIPMYGKFI